jgi:hypothetical protein
MLKGKIILITSDQKYGNLLGDDGITRQFERPEQSLLEMLSEGDTVVFTPGRSEKGPAAYDVKLEPCMYCHSIMHTVAHLCVCPLRPASNPPPVQAVKQVPARIGEMIVYFVPNASQPQRGRFRVYNLQNEEAGIFDRYDAACNFALGKDVIP